MCSALSEELFTDTYSKIVTNAVSHNHGKKNFWNKIYIITSYQTQINCSKETWMWFKDHWLLFFLLNSQTIYSFMYNVFFKISIKTFLSDRSAQWDRESLACRDAAWKVLTCPLTWRSSQCKLTVPPSSAEARRHHKLWEDAGGLRGAGVGVLQEHQATGPAGHHHSWAISEREQLEGTFS